ncbi:hypothetical protein LN996_07400 [Arthrobacter sp. AK01]|nr:hypothetical protein [Arthrobacter sp. AK01]MCD4850632.1 hypothetical protein [Arthrobacter sp. AK01]
MEVIVPLRDANATTSLVSAEAGTYEQAKASTEAKILSAKTIVSRANPDR